MISNHPLASLSGLEAISKGGNAIDAVVSALFTLSVVEPMMVSPLGGGYFIIYLAELKKIVVIDNYSTIPNRITIDNHNEYLLKQNLKNVLSIATPGALKGWEYVSNKYGEIPFEKLVEPSIRFAYDGFKITPYLADSIKRWKHELEKNDELKRIFLKKDGKALIGNEKLIQKDLANSLELIATHGADIIYKGDLGDKIIRHIDKIKGVLTNYDLENYKCIEKNPHTFNYANKQFFTTPTLGGKSLSYILDKTEKYKENGGMLHFEDETFTKFLVDTHIDTFKYRKKFCDTQVDKLSKDEFISNENSCTTHISAKDSSGNIVLATQTISKPFGAKIIVPNTGLILNNMLNIKDPLLFNNVNRRINSFMSPVIALDNTEKFYLSLGASGGDRIFGSIAQSIINVIDRKMNLESALNFGRIWARDNYVEIERSIPNSNSIRQKLINTKYKAQLRARVGAGINGFIQNDSNVFLYAGCWRTDSSPMGIGGGDATPIKSIMDKY